jgi:hypothetical protein
MTVALVSFGFSNHESPISCDYLRINFYELQNGKAQPQDAVILAFDERFNNEFDQEDTRQQHRNGPSLSIVHPEATLSVEKRQMPFSGENIPLRIMNLEPGNIYLFKISGQSLNQMEHSLVLRDDYLKKDYQIEEKESLLIEFQIDEHPESASENRFRLLSICDELRELTVCQ